MNKDNTIKVYTDGGARGNPGPAACAYVVMINNVFFHQDSKYLGVTTNNDAEYNGLILALNYLHTLDLANYSDVYFYLDSELVVKQIKGEYKIKHPKLKILFDKAQKLIKDLNKNTVFTSVPRKENFVADKLVNDRLDGII